MGDPEIAAAALKHATFLNLQLYFEHKKPNSFPDIFFGLCVLSLRRKYSPIFEHAALNELKTYFMLQRAQSKEFLHGR